MRTSTEVEVSIIGTPVPSRGNMTTSALVVNGLGLLLFLLSIATIPGIRKAERSAKFRETDLGMILSCLLLTALVTALVFWVWAITLAYRGLRRNEKRAGWVLAWCCLPPAVVLCLAIG